MKRYVYVFITYLTRQNLTQLANNNINPYIKQKHGQIAHEQEEGLKHRT